MMPVKKKLLLMVIALSFLGACNQEPLTKIDVEPQLANFVKLFDNDLNQAKSNFCSILHVKAYDKIVVIVPYTYEDDLKLKGAEIENLQKIKDSILSVNFDEGKCVLVYIKNKRAIAYSVVSRRPLDIVGNNQGVFSFSHRQCDSLVFKKLQAGWLSLIIPEY